MIDAHEITLAVAATNLNGLTQLKEQKESESQSYYRHMLRLSYEPV